MNGTIEFNTKTVGGKKVILPKTSIVLSAGDFSFRVDPNGKIGWCNDWAKQAWDYIGKGLFVNGITVPGAFGHFDTFCTVDFAKRCFSNEWGQGKETMNETEFLIELESHYNNPGKVASLIAERKATLAATRRIWVCNFNAAYHDYNMAEADIYAQLGAEPPNLNQS